MPNPPTPLNPNITTGAHTGRVVTDRYDFEKHVTGVDFKHDAVQLTLNPAVNINSVEYDNVQAALTELAALSVPPTLPDATSVVKGVLRLNGDLAGTGGTALTPRVSGLQGSPVNTLTPTLNQVLTWNGSAWGPAAGGNTFTASGDLDGNNIAQTVIGITGDGASAVDITARFLVFNGTVTSPVIAQDDTASGAGQDLTIAAQDTNQAAQTGGSIRLVSGDGGSGGVAGGISLSANGAPLIHVAVPAVGRRVVGLVPSADITATQMPANTGDRVVYIAEAATAPSTGIPVGGAILYSRANGLWTKNQDGYDFQLGTRPNPNFWGSAAEGGTVIEYRSVIRTTTATPDIAFAKSFADAEMLNAMVKVDVVCVGKEFGATDASIHNLVRGYVSSGSTPTAVGATTSTDARTNGGASGWTIPSITTTGTTLQILTGANAATTIYWFVTVKLTCNNDA